MTTKFQSTIHYPNGHTMTNSHATAEEALRWSRKIATIENCPVSVKRVDRKKALIRVYPDKAILRQDVRLDLARAMTIKEGARALNG